MLTFDTLQEISQAVKTPCYVFDTDELISRTAQIKAIVGNDIKLCYAMKANPFLVTAMAPCVDFLEVCSPGELNICEALNVPMDKIILSGVQKTSDYIAHAIENNVGVYTAESLLHVQLLQEQALKANKILPVLLRLTSGSQFGMDELILKDIIKNRNAYTALEFVGLHYFVGTQRSKPAEQIGEISQIIALCNTLKADFDFAVRRIEYGPGLIVSYFVKNATADTLAPLCDIMPSLTALSQIAQLTIEMGRFFAAFCGYYLTKVMDIKTNNGINYAIVDGGINHITYYGQTMGMKIPLMYHFKQGEKLPRSTQQAQMAGDVLYTLCGSLCTTADVLIRAVSLAPLTRGDLLVLCNLGAYSVTEGLYLFLSRKMPYVLLYSQKNGATVVRTDFETNILNTIRS